MTETDLQELKRILHFGIQFYMFILVGSLRFWTQSQLIRSLIDDRNYCWKV